MQNKPRLNQVPPAKALAAAAETSVSVQALQKERKPCRAHLASGFQKDCAWCRGTLG